MMNQYIKNLYPLEDACGAWVGDDLLVARTLLLLLLLLETNVQQQVGPSTGQPSLQLPTSQSGETVRQAMSKQARSS
jgi:hypothetical protein